MITNNKLILEVIAIDYTNIIDFSIIGSWHPHNGLPSFVITLLNWVLNEGCRLFHIGQLHNHPNPVELSIPIPQ